ncbi:septum site-determining protein MinC [Nitrosomonas sp. JL21]|uniref:septum site-determining protein MinC n=1 Tax=Nitrosomonas sp. JL21 TaxID=153949 RepID=UPI00137099B3|nr:septum site-determining protein MinC [Nitrosomonas sp. JL21]MBL8496597.1 septum site-determining protein MinC [Nitrosomonas sp.]MCC7090922.1 septum site-determining protein MinC [Nitrosomonas sp.]MXS76489.1 septum site-determining protein MinC [Nitrosomonas sp. JL21]
MPNTNPVLEFKSSTFFAPILILFKNDMIAIEESLQEKINLAPEFFKDSPLIIDLRELNKHQQDFDFAQIVQMVRKVGFFPVGIRGGSEQQNMQARALSIPVDAGRDQGNSAPLGEPQKQDLAQQPAAQPETTVAHEPPSSAAVPPPAAATMLITQPIRSGQRIYATGDLIILSQVSAGAEIMAEGNIHVYNTLRGRALAGVHGNTAARIFCFDLQAELISIAGDYKTSEDLNKQTHDGPVQIYLQDHALIIKEIA